MSVDEFERDYMRANRPAIVTDALTEWRLPERWTPDYLLRHFADEKVQVYNSYFDFKSIKKLGVYLQERFNRTDTHPDPPYVRWYTKLRNVEFFWADAAFAKMAPNWSSPYFMPRADYVLPFAPAPRTVDPTLDLFPARGLFISERGARTGLHVDPWGSDAVLCQLYGAKTWAMYAPDQARYLEANGNVVDLDKPDLEKFPDYARARATCEFVLQPGEVLYVPHGWYHTAHSTSDSISLTWNFVHCAGLAAFEDWLAKPRSRIDDDVISFFYTAAVGPDVTSDAVARLVATHFDNDTARPGRAPEATAVR